MSPLFPGALTRHSDQHLPGGAGPSRTGLVVRVKDGVDYEDAGNPESHIQNRQGLLAEPHLGGRHGGFGACRNGTGSGVQWRRGSPSLPSSLPELRSRQRVPAAAPGRLSGDRGPAAIRHVRAAPPPRCRRRRFLLFFFFFCSCLRSCAGSAGGHAGSCQLWFSLDTRLSQTDGPSGNSSTRYRDFDGSARSCDAACLLIPDVT